MKYKMFLFFIIIIAAFCMVFAACADDGVTPENEPPTDDKPLVPADESFFYDFLGMDKNTSSALVRLMPAPYGDIRTTVNGEILSLTLNYEESSGQYVLYYCINEDGAFNIYKTLSVDGVNWDFGQSKEKYITAGGTATVVAGNCAFYVENSDGLRLKNIDGTKNIPLGLNGSVCSAFYKDGKYMIYAADESGTTRCCIVENDSPSLIELEDNVKISSPAGKFVLDCGDKYLAFSKRSADGVSDFTVSLSLDGKNFNSFNGAYICADPDPSAGLRSCSRFIANGTFDVTSDNPSQDKSVGLYLYEVKDGNTSIRLFKLRKGGVAALYGDISGAVVQGDLKMSDAQSLVLNYQTGATGYIDLEIIDKTGVSVFDYHIHRGNNINFEIILNDVATAAINDGAVVKMQLFDAYLYDLYAKE